jgi:CRP-like cAMP-binding protein
MDLRKVKDKAAEAFAKGKFAKAAELYEAYCAGDSKDFQARLRMGDAFAKAGARERAIGAYKFAAEGFAREGFLPRAIAASKLILELDPTHRGVQQMLADLYAKKSAPDPKRRTITSQMQAIPVPATPSFNEIALPAEEPAPRPPPPPPPPEPEPEPEVLELTEEAAGGVDLQVDHSSELPPELALPPPQPEEDAGEIIADAIEETPIPPPPTKHLISVNPATSGTPPGLKPRRITSEIPVPAAPKPEEEVVELTNRVPPPPESSTLTPMQYPPIHPQGATSTTTATPPPATAPAPTPAPTAAAPKPPSRIWLPDTFQPPPGAAAPPPAPEPAAPPQPEPESPRAASRFDELDLDMAPPTPAPPAPAPRGKPPPGLPSFTQLELEGDSSLLHAVELAAQAGITQRAEAHEPERVEESMSSVAEDFQGESKTPAGLPKIPLFSDLSADAFIELFERCPLLRFGMNERILEQGSVGDSFFVICAGSVRVLRLDESGEQKELAVLQEGAFFGEVALLSGAPRTASVVGNAEETQLLEISATVLAQLSHRSPQVATALKKFCRQRLLANVMNASPLFKPFGRKDRKELVERFRARDVKKNDLIIKEGVDTDGLYVVLSGEVEVRKGKTRLATLHEGEIFGEMSLLQKSPATASVSATRRTSLLRLPREVFDQVILTHPQVLQLISELSEARQKMTEAALSGELLV